MDIKPCPFCGGLATFTIDTKVKLDENAAAYRNVDVAFVECTVCGAQGHEFDTELLRQETAQFWAVSAWNLRK